MAGLNGSVLRVANTGPVENLFVRSTCAKRSIKWFFLVPVASLIIFSKTNIYFTLT